MSEKRKLYDGSLQACRSSDIMQPFLGYARPLFRLSQFAMTTMNRSSGPDRIPVCLSSFCFNYLENSSIGLESPPLVDDDRTLDDQGGVTS